MSEDAGSDPRAVATLALTVCPLNSRLNIIHNSFPVLLCVYFHHSPRLTNRAADPHRFDADLDPDTSFHFDEDPDPTFHFDADRGIWILVHIKDANLKLLVYSPSTALFLSVHVPAAPEL